MQWVPTQEFLTLIDIDIRAGAALQNNSAILFTNSPVLTWQSVIGDLTPPTFTAYADKAITWQAIREDTNHNLVEESGLLSWQPSATTSLPQTIFGVGVYTTITSVKHLEIAGLLDTPITLSGTLDVVNLVVQILLPVSSVYGTTTELP